jgi:hypothetical protein
MAATNTLQRSLHPDKLGSPPVTSIKAKSEEQIVICFLITVADYYTAGAEQSVSGASLACNAPELGRESAS